MSVEPRWLTPQKSAEYMGLESRQTLQRLRDKGEGARSIPSAEPRSSTVCRTWITGSSTGPGFPQSAARLRCRRN